MKAICSPRLILAVPSFRGAPLSPILVPAARKTRKAVREEKPYPLWRCVASGRENAQTVDIGEIHPAPLPEARDTRNPSNVCLLAEEGKSTESRNFPINIFMLFV